MRAIRASARPRPISAMARASGSGRAFWRSLQNEEACDEDEAIDRHAPPSRPSSRRRTAHERAGRSHQLRSRADPHSRQRPAVRLPAHGAAPISRSAWPPTMSAAFSGLTSPICSSSPVATSSRKPPSRPSAAASIISAGPDATERMFGVAAPGRQAALRSRHPFLRRLSGHRGRAQRRSSPASIPANSSA